MEIKVNSIFKSKCESEKKELLNNAAAYIIINREKA